MSRVNVNNLDFLAARIHARRSRLAEGGRLEALCSLPDVQELGRAIYPETGFHTVAEFQRRLAQDLIFELSGFLAHMEDPGAALVKWLMTRFQVENIKVLLRGFMRGEPAESLDRYLLSVPEAGPLNKRSLKDARSLEEFAERLPSGQVRRSLRKALGVYHDQDRPFFFECAVDRSYLQELLVRTNRLSARDLELIQPIMFQEVDTFHLMLAVRGRFHYGAEPALLQALHVTGSRIGSECFRAMLAASDVPAAAALAVGRAVDALPVEPGSRDASTRIDASGLETLGWKRFLRLCQRAFRKDHMGLGAVIGYVGIRRAEVANLITLSEEVASATPAEMRFSRLIPRKQMEPVYV